MRAPHAHPFCLAGVLWFTLAVTTVEVERIGVGPRMTKCVKHNGTCYLSGMVAQKAPSASITEQAKSTLADIEVLLEEAGTNKGEGGLL